VSFTHTEQFISSDWDEMPRSDNHLIVQSDIGGAASVVVRILMDEQLIVCLQRKYRSEAINAMIRQQTKTVLQHLPMKEHLRIDSSSSSTWRLLPSISESKTFGSLMPTADTLEVSDKEVNIMSIHTLCVYTKENRFPPLHRRLHRVELNHWNDLRQTLSQISSQLVMVDGIRTCC
jgi:hypothetical protein